MSKYEKTLMPAWIEFALEFELVKMGMPPPVGWNLINLN
jgi:hypothetical protein